MLLMYSVKGKQDQIADRQSLYGNDIILSVLVLLLEAPFKIEMFHDYLPLQIDLRRETDDIAVEDGICHRIESIATSDEDYEVMA